MTCGMGCHVGFREVGCHMEHWVGCHMGHEVGCHVRRGVLQVKNLFKSQNL